MQPYLHVLTFNLALSLLCFSPASASITGHVKRFSPRREGYRCGQRIISLELVHQAAQKALRQPIHDSDIYGAESLYPIPYNGFPEFHAVEQLWLWPLFELGDESLDNDNYFIVLGSDLLSVFGIIWQQNNAYEKCTKEIDLSDTLGYNFALGYRCPHAIYSFETITRTIELSKDVVNKDFTIRYPTRFPISDIFDDTTLTNLFRWPITPDGTFDSGGTKPFRFFLAICKMDSKLISHTYVLAIESVIIDENSKLMGMVYKRKNKTYYRCRLTVKDKILSKFVGKALEQKPTRVDLESVDVFHCGEYYISSHEILEGTTEVHKISKQNIEKGYHKNYPNVYKTATETGFGTLYKWPIRISSEGITYRAKFSRFDKFFLVLDDFNDVHGVMMKIDINKFEDCIRKTVDKKFYKSNLSRFKKGLTSNEKKSGTPVAKHPA